MPSRVCLKGRGGGGGLREVHHNFFLKKNFGCFAPPEGQSAPSRFCFIIIYSLQEFAFFAVLGGLQSFTQVFKSWIFLNPIHNNNFFDAIFAI